MAHKIPASGSGASRAFLAGALILLASCSHKDKVDSTPPPPDAAGLAASSSGAGAFAAKPGLSPQQRYALGLQLLQQGQTAEARAELAQLQLDRPGDRRSAQLLREIDTDPQQLYGSDSFAYTVRAGDTLFSLARKYLKDPLNFYGLAQFNHLTLPVELQPGQTILIPGHPRAPERSAVVPRRPAPAPAEGAADASRPAPPAPPAADRAAQRQQAQKLRQQGLEQMSAGSIDRAVTLLSHAASLDPDNAAIVADLARARRIQATVHSK